MQNIRRPRSLGKKGFTLIELMIVVVIIGILAALAIPRFGAASARAKEKEADGLLKAYYTAQTAYSAKFGTFATDPDEINNQVGWELPPRAEHYDLETLTVDDAATKTLAKIDGRTGYCDREINMATGELTSVSCN